MMETAGEIILEIREKLTRCGVFFGEDIRKWLDRLDAAIRRAVQRGIEDAAELAILRDRMREIRDRAIDVIDDDGGTYRKIVELAQDALQADATEGGEASATEGSANAEKTKAADDYVSAAVSGERKLRAGFVRHGARAVHADRADPRRREGAANGRVRRRRAESI